MGHVPVLCQLLLKGFARIVPRAQRDEWYREWYGEVWYYGGNAQSAVIHTLGAARDACFVRWNDAGFADALTSLLRRPATLLAALAVVIAAIAAGTNGLEGTRRWVTPLPFSAPRQLMVLRQAGLLMGARLGLPKGHIEPAHKASTLAGIAAYAPYHALVETGAWKEASAAAVDANFFAVLGVEAQTGKLFHQTALADCVECVVISDEMWRAEFHRDPNITRRIARIGGKQQQIVGVLPHGFWFFGDSPRLYTLSTRASFLTQDRSLVYAIARLKPGVTSAQSLEELNRLWRTLPKLIRSRQIEMWPLASLTQDPLYGWLPVIVAAMAALSSAAYALFGRVRRAAFFSAKLALAFLIAVLSAIEFAYAPGMHMSGTRAWGPEMISLWLLIAGCAAAGWFALWDQRRRCRACLSRLAMPATMGSRGHVLMDPSSTELVCPNGHGLLWSAGEPLESSAENKWVELDESWQDLFAHSGKE